MADVPRDMFGNDMTQTDSFGTPPPPRPHSPALLGFKGLALGIPPEQVVDDWERWCGETPWSIALRRFGELGGRVIWWGGYPRSASAIPLCFVLYDREGQELPREINHSRLKDIRAGITYLRESGVDNGG